MPIPSKPCFLFVIQLNRDEKIYNAPAKVTKSLWFLCVCVCVQIFCTHSCMHVYVCANTYEGQKLISIVFFNALHLVLWNRLSLWIWKPQIKLDDLASKSQASSCPLKLWDYKWMLPHALLCLFFFFLMTIEEPNSGLCVYMANTLPTESFPQTSGLLRKPWAKPTNTCSFVDSICEWAYSEMCPALPATFL